MFKILQVVNIAMFTFFMNLKWVVDDDFSSSNEYSGKPGVSHIEAMCHKDVLLCNVTCDVIKLCALQLWACRLKLWKTLGWSGDKKIEKSSPFCSTKAQTGSEYDDKFPWVERRSKVRCWSARCLISAKSFWCLCILVLNWCNIYQSWYQESYTLDTKVFSNFDTREI